MEDNTKRMNDAYDYLLYRHMINGQEDLARYIKTSRPNVTAMLNGRTKVTDDTLRKINDAFPNVFNLTWLLTGELPMLIDEVVVTKKQVEIPEYVQQLVDTATKLIQKNHTLELKLEHAIAHNEILSDQLSTLITIMGVNKRVDIPQWKVNDQERDTSLV